MQHMHGVGYINDSVGKTSFHQHAWKQFLLIRFRRGHAMVLLAFTIVR